MIHMYDIPEEERVCVNCKYFGVDMDKREFPTLCHGMFPCSNYDDDNNDNYFQPDDDYLSIEQSCAACRFDGDEDTCAGCSRHYPDIWERQTENI